MAKLRIVCPCPGATSMKGYSKQSPASLTRRVSNSLNSGQSSGFLNLLGIAFILFVATTYLVFSLDTMMEVEDEVVPTMKPRRLLGDFALRTLRGSSGHTDPNDKLVIISEEDLPSLSSNDRRNEPILHNDTPRPTGPSGVVSDADFADSLNTVGLALLNAESTGSDQLEGDTIDGMEEPPKPIEEEGDVLVVTKESIIVPPPLPASLTPNGNNPSSPNMALLHVTDLKKIHTCKYGRSETSPTIAFGTWIWRHKKSAVGHDEYVKTPSETRLKNLKAAVHFVSDSIQDWKNAYVSASLAGYTLCKIDLQFSVVLAWQPRNRGDALFFTRHDGNSTVRETTNLVIEVPHPQFDHTLHQGLHVFSESRAKALLLSESHRCSRSLANKCTGNDGEAIRSMCAGRSSYHNSDVAHATSTAFHAVHEQIAEDNPSALVASLHATKAEEFVVSDGTSGRASGHLVTFAQSLARELEEKTVVGLCNEFANPKDSSSSSSSTNLISVPEERRHLCGSTNVQGRHLNGAEDSCRAKVKRAGLELTSSGRFLHVEQPVNLVLPPDSKSNKPVMSLPLSTALVEAVDKWLLEKKVDYI